MDSNTIKARIIELRAEPSPTDQQREELAGLEVAAKVMGIPLPEATEAAEVTEPTQDATVEVDPVTLGADTPVEPAQEGADFQGASVEAEEAEAVADPARTDDPSQNGEAVSTAEVQEAEATPAEEVAEEVVAEQPEAPQTSHTDIVKNDRKILWTMMEQLESLKSLHPEAGRELATAYTRLQESRHWLGEVLGKLGIELPSEYADKA
jgi:hypothetical protein